MGVIRFTDYDPSKDGSGYGSGYGYGDGSGYGWELVRRDRVSAEVA